MAEIIDFPDGRTNAAKQGDKLFPIPVPEELLKEYEHILSDAEHEELDLDTGEGQYRMGRNNIGHYLGNFSCAAIKGNANGQYVLARLLEIGAYDEVQWLVESGKRDLLAAAYWYWQAEKQGLAEAVGHARRLFDEVLALAKAGDADAQFDIAACFETGIFPWIEKSPKAAVEWYEKSAVGGNAVATFVLGKILFLGAYVLPRDVPRAFEYLDRWQEAILAEFPNNMLSELRSIYSFSMFVNLLGGPAPFDDPLIAYFEHGDNRRLERDWGLFGSKETQVTGDFEKALEEIFEGGYRLEKQFLYVVLRYRANGSIDEARQMLRNMLWHSDDINGVGSDEDPEYDSAPSLLMFAHTNLWGDPFGDFKDRKPAEPEVHRCRKMEAVLRELAEKGVEEAALLLGLVLIGSSGDAATPDAAEGKGWLEQGVRHKDLLNCLWYARLALSQQIEAKPSEIKTALKRVVYSNWEEAEREKHHAHLPRRKYEENKEIWSEEYFLELQGRAAMQLETIEREEAIQQAREEAQRDMLSYLTHTLNNTLSSGPEAARQTMRILGSEMYENNRDYKAINNIAAMFSTFLFAQQLLKTFKLYIADPELLRRNWVADQTGDASIPVVMALTLRQTLSQLVFSANHQASLQRLLPQREAGAIKAVRKSFMEAIVPLDVDASNTALVFDWVRDHLGVVHIEMDASDELHFNSNNTRFTFLFSSFSELVYNALKYSDGRQPIELSWRKIDGNFVFRCANAWSEESVQSSEGSGKGLLFLKRLVEMLGATLVTENENGNFVAEIRLPEVLMLGGT